MRQYQDPCLQLRFDIWMAQEQSKLVTTPFGYTYGWINPRGFPEFKEKENVRELEST